MRSEVGSLRKKHASTNANINLFGLLGDDVEIRVDAYLDLLLYVGSYRKWPYRSIFDIFG